MSAPLPPVPVLLHGFLGFVRLGPAVYFRGVEQALRADGIVPLIPVPVTAYSSPMGAGGWVTNVPRHSTLPEFQRGPFAARPFSRSAGARP